MPAARVWLKPGCPWATRWEAEVEPAMVAAGHMIERMPWEGRAASGVRWSPTVEVGGKLYPGFMPWAQLQEQMNPGG